MPRKNKFNKKHKRYVAPDYHSQNKDNDDASKPSNKKKNKLRTSYDVYKRLIHDPGLGIDLNYVMIGYSDKLYGDQEMPLLDWKMIDNGGDIPMHHILYFVLNLIDGKQIIIWDRKTKLDRLYCSGETNKNTKSLKQLLNTINIQNIPISSIKKQQKINKNDINIDADDCKKNKECGYVAYHVNNVDNGFASAIKLLDNLISVFTCNTSANQITFEYDTKRRISEPSVMCKLSRNEYRKIAADTQQIMDNKSFIHPQSKQVIDISSEMDFSCKNTELYEEKYPFTYTNISSSPNKYRKYNVMNISITHETTLDCAYRLTEEYGNDIKICLLNFSSARNIGGGWDNGANAQEESIARSSTLIHTLKQYKSSFYDFNKKRKTLLYSHSLIYSPNIIIMKHGNGMYIDRDIYGYYKCNIITSPAVNCGYINRAKKTDPMMIKYGGINSNQDFNENERKKAAKLVVEHVMYERCKRVLELAMKYDNEYLILGAWGCGVFKNDPSMIAYIFADLLKNRYKNTFKNVIFAILNDKKKQTLNKFIYEFKKVCG